MVKYVMKENSNKILDHNFLHKVTNNQDTTSIETVHGHTHISLSRNKMYIKNHQDKFKKQIKE